MTLKPCYELTCASHRHQEPYSQADETTDYSGLPGKRFAVHTDRVLQLFAAVLLSLFFRPPHAFQGWDLEVVSHFLNVKLL